VLETRLKTRSKREWTEFFIGVGLPAGPINTLDEVFDDPQVRHCQLVETLEHPTLGPLRQVVTPVSSSAAAGEMSPHVSRHAPPGLGQHTVDVLREAGFDAAAIEALLATKAVHQQDRPDEYNARIKDSEPAAGVTR
jgi:crotonobetainyl-CoA:carnitine CoA-transferase CaiB-like acyl-CoA transferase